MYAPSDTEMFDGAKALTEGCPKDWSRPQAGWVDDIVRLREIYTGFDVFLAGGERWTIIQQSVHHLCMDES